MEAFQVDYGDALNNPLDGSSTAIDGLVCGGKVMLDWNIVVMILVIVLLLGCFFRYRSPENSNFCTIGQTLN